MTGAHESPEDRSPVPIGEVVDGIARVLSGADITAESTPDEVTKAVTQGVQEHHHAADDLLGLIAEKAIHEDQPKSPEE